MKILLQLTLIALFSSPVFAQWAKVPPTPIPRGADTVSLAGCFALRWAA